MSWCYVYIVCDFAVFRVVVYVAGSNVVCVIVFDYYDSWFWGGVVFV